VGGFLAFCIVTVINIPNHFFLFFQSGRAVVGRALGSHSYADHRYWWLVLESCLSVVTVSRSIGRRFHLLERRTPAHTELAHHPVDFFHWKPFSLCGALRLICATDFSSLIRPYDQFLLSLLDVPLQRARHVLEPIVNGHGERSSPFSNGHKAKGLRNGVRSKFGFADDVWNTVPCRR